MMQMNTSDVQLMFGLKVASYEKCSDEILQNGNLGSVSQSENGLDRLFDAHWKEIESFVGSLLITTLISMLPAVVFQTSANRISEETKAFPSLSTRTGLHCSKLTGYGVPDATSTVTSQHIGDPS